MNLDDLERLEAATTDGWHCTGCGKLDTRCACGEIALEAMPALLRVARAADALRAAQKGTHRDYPDDIAARNALVERCKRDLDEALRALEEQ